MLVLTWFTALLIASPFTFAQRRPAGPAPVPCKRMSPPPSEAETRTRFNSFVQAFVGPKKNISEAFEYIAADYIVRYVCYQKYHQLRPWNFRITIQWQRMEHSLLGPSFLPFGGP
jgi:hypothetical protein